MKDPPGHESTTIVRPQTAIYHESSLVRSGLNAC